MKTKPECLTPLEYLICSATALAVFFLCVCAGSVTVPFADTISAIFGIFANNLDINDVSQQIIISVRLPRVICVALSGAALSLCGAAAQGLLRNPLADGSTIGVSSGAALGASLAIALGLRAPFGTMPMAIIFAFGSLVLILSLSYKLDYSLSTDTIILTGVIFSMFANAMISLIIAFGGDKSKTVIFWTMGSFAGSSYLNAGLILTALIVCSFVILGTANELNAFAIGEDNARLIGINIKNVKLAILVGISVLIGVCVSIGGIVGFAGLVVPHMTRMLVGANHRRLLPSAMFSGAIFLMLADLLSRVLLNPLELPIGVITSIIGSIVFVFIFYSRGKVR